MKGSVTHTFLSSPAFPPEMLSPAHLPGQSPSLNPEDIKPKGQKASHHSVGPQKAHELNLAESPRDPPTRQLTLRGAPKRRNVPEVQTCRNARAGTISVFLPWRARKQNRWQRSVKKPGNNSFWSFRVK